MDQILHYFCLSLLHPSLDYFNARCWVNPTCKPVFNRFPKVPHLLPFSRDSVFLPTFLECWANPPTIGRSTQLLFPALEVLNSAGWLSRVGTDQLQWELNIRPLGLHKNQLSPSLIVTSENKATSTLVLNTWNANPSHPYDTHYTSVLQPTS